MKTTLILAATIAAYVTGDLNSAPIFNSSESSGYNENAPLEYRAVKRTVGILTNLSTPNDNYVRSLYPNRALVRTDDPAFADPQWHRVIGAKYLVARCVPTQHYYTPTGHTDYNYVTETAVVSDAWRYPVEHEPVLVWSQAYGAFVPYPVDYGHLSVAPEISHIGYSKLAPSAPQLPQPTTPPVVTPLTKTAPAVKSGDEAVTLTEKAGDKHTLLRVWGGGTSHFLTVDETEVAKS